MLEAAHLDFFLDRLVGRGCRAPLLRQLAPSSDIVAMRRSRLCPGGKVIITVIHDFGRSLGSLLGLGLGFLEIVCDLVRRQFLPAAAWQAFQQQPTNAGAGQSLDFVAEHVEHETDLAFETLLQDDVQDIGVLHPDTLSLGVTFFGHHAVE